MMYGLSLPAVKSVTAANGETMKNDLKNFKTSVILDNEANICVVNDMNLLKDVHDIDPTIYI